MKSPREEMRPTNRDLANGLQTLGNRLEVLAASIDARFGAFEDRFDKLDARLDTMNVLIDGIDERLIGVERRLGGLEVVVLELQEEVRAGFRAYDTDSIKLLDHERRIKRLEKAK